MSNCIKIFTSFVKKLISDEILSLSNVLIQNVIDRGEKCHNVFERTKWADCAVIASRLLTELVRNLWNRWRWYNFFTLRKLQVVRFHFIT